MIMIFYNLQTSNPERLLRLIEDWDPKNQPAGTLQKGRVNEPKKPVGVLIYGCFLKWWYPKMDGLQWKTLLKWMIWGYHYFRKPSYGSSKFPPLT